MNNIQFIKIPTYFKEGYTDKESYYTYNDDSIISVNSIISIYEIKQDCYIDKTNKAKLYCFETKYGRTYVTDEKAYMYFYDAYVRNFSLEDKG